MSRFSRFSGFSGYATLVAAILNIFSANPSQAQTLPRPQHLDIAGIPAQSFPQSTSYCLTNYGIHCYQPAQLATAYNLTSLHAAGINGSGETIVIVVCFGSPTIANDLHVFDQQFGLPDPPNFTVLQPLGQVPAFDPTNSDMVDWAEEATIDVEFAHIFAPGAAIVLVETPVSETEGLTGFPEIVQAENYVINNGIGDVISQSFGTAEANFPNAAAIYNLRSAFQNAASHNVTVLAASGDNGPTGREQNQTDIYTTPTDLWPSSDPLVTSVGGTRLTLDDAGNRLAPDVVWSDSHGAGGGGLSAVFSRPAFQYFVQGVVTGWRGTPDVSMSAAIDGAGIIYSSFLPGQVGYRLVAGTSEACPQFAGIVAMADQVAGHRLGTLSNRLYWLSYSAFVDITSGNNTYGPFTNSDGNTYTVTGYPALPGYDLASGLGTVDAPTIVNALATQGGNSGGCTVSYTINPENNSLFGATMSITNNGRSTLSGWTLAWSFANGQTITGSWNGTVSQSGGHVTVSEQSGQTWEDIPAGGTYSGFGFNGTWNGTTNAIPTSFTLNGTACTVN